MQNLGLRQRLLRNNEGERKVDLTESQIPDRIKPSPEVGALGNDRKWLSPFSESASAIFIRQLTGLVQNTNNSFLTISSLRF